VIFVDSNIPMYLVGADHPNKESARRLLERAITDGELLVSDAEILQEILHRYVAIGRRDAIEPATEALLGVIDEVFPIERADVERAGRVVHETRLSARDAVHLAIMRRHGIDRIMTFDRAFDEIEGISRVGP
jgi:predicted nucleic acid-binding protein